MKQHQRRDSSQALALMALVGLAGLGCLVPGEGGGLDLDLGGAGDDEWEEDVEERRRQRDDPSDPEFRGRFDVQLGGARQMTLDASSLGEATFEHVEQDLIGSPPHCLITLADREPDAQGRQGYMLLQRQGPSCDLEPGELEVVGDWEQAPAGSRAIVFKTLRLDIENEQMLQSESYGQPGGVVTITEANGRSISGVFDVMMGEHSVEGGEPEPTELEVMGDFQIVEREL